MLKNITKRKILIGIIVLVVVSFAFYTIFLKKEGSTYSSIKVIRGNVAQEVSETGTVKMGEELNFSFRSAGKIEKIYVSVGKEVKAGQILAKLDTTQFYFQLKEAEANLEVTQAQYNKLIIGASPEEIKIAQTAVSNAQTTLANAEKNLQDVKAIASENLSNAYGDALTTLDDAYLKISNAYETAKQIQVTYFVGDDQQGLNVREAKETIGISLNKVKSYLDTAKANPKNENIDTAVSETKKYLANVSDALETIRQMTEEPIYRDSVSSTNKTLIDTQRTNITVSLTSVTNSQQVISLTKIDNEADINTAESQVSTAEGALNKAEDELSKLLSSPRQEDVDLYQAKVKQAQAQVDLLKAQINESSITSPVAGKITKINKNEGETVQPTESVISFISNQPFQIQADIYEEDIVNVRVGSPVEIKLTAFPDKVFDGEVILINPAEKLVEGVVYYEVTIDFQNAPQGTKPGMSADISIKTAQKNNVLVIPEAAIENKNGKTFVQIVKGKNLQESEIQAGLKGEDDMVEVVSGLNEGDTIAVKN